jgi:protein-tyrosine-phosphatase
MKVLFVCRGNVGRSQMAEALFKKYVKGDYEVSSAGTKLSGEECALIDIPLAGTVIDVIKEEGIDVSQNHRNQLTEEMFDKADKVVLVVDDADPVPEYVLGSDKVTRWNIPDPKGTSLERHREILNQIKELIVSTTF